MKSLRKVFIMFAVTTAIVVFWLAPGINKAEDAKYTRRYEDTDAKFVVASDTAVKKNSKITLKADEPVRQAKVYKRESISSKTKLKDVSPKMYSRAMQFEEPLVLDSLTVAAVAVDTMKVMP